MHIRFGTILAVAASVILGGCGGSPSPAQQQSAARDAFMQAPQDSAQFFYAVGEGDTATLAKNNALGEISSRISVSISSSIDNTMSVSRENGNESSSQNIETRVNAVAKTIEYAGVSVEETQDEGDLKKVLVKVDREILYQSYLKKLQRVDDAITKEMEILNKASVFTQLKMSHQIRTSMRKADEYLLLLQAMKPGFDEKQFRDKYAGYENTLRDVRQGAVFSIKSDKNSEALSTVIKRYLSDENLKMSNKAANVNLQLSTIAQEKNYKTTNTKLAKMNIVVRTATIKAVDGRGVALSNNVITTKAASSISKEEAVAQTKQYEKLIQEEGIISFLIGKE